MPANIPVASLLLDSKAGTEPMWSQSFVRARPRRRTTTRSISRGDRRLTEMPARNVLPGVRISYRHILRYLDLVKTVTYAEAARRALRKLPAAAGEQIRSKLKRYA